MRHRPSAAVRAAVATVAAFSVLLALGGCRNSAGDDSYAAPGAGGRTAVTGVGYDADGLTRVLAEAGVGTVADERSSQPVVPVHGRQVTAVTAWQVRNMAAETRSHGGVLGQALDQSVPMPPGAPPMAFVLGGWISSRVDADAVAAGRLTGSADWTHAESVVFSSAVLQLFIADVLDHAGSSASSTASGEPSATAAPAAYVTGLPAGGCTGVASFVDGVLSSIFAALKVNPADVANWVSGKVGGTVGVVVGSIAGFFASFWNVAVDLAEKAVRNILATLTAPVLNTLRTVIAALETITTVLTYLKRWTVPMTPDPTSNSFSVIGASAHRGSVTATVDRKAESDHWPDLLADCAQALGKPVPTLSAKGEPVTWTTEQEEPGLISVDRPTNGAGSLDDNLSDRLDYTAGKEDATTAVSPDVVLSTVTVSASIRRTEIDELGDLLLTSLSKTFPPLIQPAVRLVLTPMFEWVKHVLDQFTSVDGSTRLIVSHHVRQPDPTPSSGPTTPSSPTSPAPAWKPADPCTLVPAADVASASGHPVRQTKAVDNAITTVCPYGDVWDAGGKHYELTVDVSVYDQQSTAVDLDRGRAGHGDWTPVGGLGQRAYSSLNTTTVTFWQSGQLVEVHFLQSNYTWSSAESLLAATTLAKIAASRL